MNKTTQDLASSPTRDLLSEIRHSMYCRSERWWWASLGSVAAGILAATTVITGAVPEHSVAATLLTIISIATPALASGTRWISGDYARNGDTCRRLILNHDAMGKAIDTAVAREVALWSRRSISTVTTNPYFASDRPHGPRRLVEDVCESAFFTGELAKLTANFGFFVVGIFICVPVLAWVGFSDVRIAVSKQASLVLGALAILTVGVLVAKVLVHALHYMSLSKDTIALSRRASDLARHGEPTDAEAFQLAEDYSIALARNLPIINWLYEREKSRIESAYNQALGSR